MSTWVFGYGSLVSPVSVARTIGREVTGAGFRTARLAGFGRRWNYGSPGQRGSWTGPSGRVDDGVVVCLGLTASSDESCNGVVLAVTDDELALLDRRERDYDRVDVSELVSLGAGDRVDRIVTYVPRPSAVERYEEARDAGRAAVRRAYHDLVDAAFAVLGDRDAHEYRRRTPAPDVPVVDVA